MKASLHRLLAVTVCLDIVALVVAFALRHAKHGTGEAVGAIAWVALWADTLVVLLLTGIALARTARRRSTLRTAAR